MRTKPTVLHLIEGTESHKKDGKTRRQREPKPSGKIPEPPAHLSDAEVENWKQIIAAVPDGLLTSLDRVVFESYIRAWTLSQSAAAMVRAQGPVLTTTLGNVIQNPYLAVMNKQTLIAMKAAIEMGFTPAARTRIAIVPNGKPEKDKAESYFDD